MTPEDLLAAQSKLIDQQAATIAALQEALRLAGRGPIDRDDTWRQNPKDDNDRVRELMDAGRLP